MPGFPFIGPTYQTQSTKVGVERLVNLYVEVTEAPDEPTQATYYGTPGLERLTTLAGGAGRGIFAQDGRCWAVAGQVLYELEYPPGGAVTGTARGTVANDGLPVTFASNGIAGHQLFVVSGGNGYILDLNTDAFSPITVNFPADCLMGAFVDGYFLALWADHFQISALEDGLTWNAADTARPSISSDHLRALIVNHREVWLFGEQSTEVWYNAGTGTFPFAPIPGVFIDMGITPRAAVTRFDNAIAWVGENHAGDRMVFRAEQYTPQRISTHAVEWALRSYETIDDLRAWTYQEAGHSFLVLTSPANGATWVFDASVPPAYAWSERGWWNGIVGVYEAQRQIAHAFYGGEHICLDREHGAVYEQALGIPTDDGVPIRSLRRLPHANADNQTLFFAGFELLLEPGVGLDTGQGADPALMLRWSNDGGFTWSAEAWTSAGRKGTYGTRACWTRLGRGRSRVFEVVQTDAVKRAWIGARVDVTPGTS
jgi:Phage stabilisation protein